MEKLRSFRAPKIALRDISNDLSREPADTAADSTEDLQPHSSLFVEESELPNEALQHSVSSEQCAVDLSEELESSFRVHLGVQIDSDELSSSSEESSDDEGLSADDSKSIWKQWLNKLSKHDLKMMSLMLT